MPARNQESKKSQGQRQLPAKLQPGSNHPAKFPARFQGPNGIFTLSARGGAAGGLEAFE